MKKTNLFAILALAATPAFLHAQSTVSTPIVGFSTITGNANGGSGTRYSLVAANLLNSASWSGPLNGSLQASANSFTAGAFNSGSVYPKFYVEIVDGPAAGSQADILSNTTDTLTVSGQASFQTAIGSGAAVKIRKHRTLVDVFGGASGTTGDTSVALAKGSNAGSADNVILKENGVDRSFFYSSSALRPGWRDNNLNSAADRPIYPNQGIILARKSNSNVNVVVTGEVKSGVSFIDLPAGFNLVTYPIPADSTLPSIFGGASGAASATDVKVAKGAGVNSADNILLANANGTYATYFYSSSALRPGWRDSSLNAAATNIVPGNVGVFIKKINSGNLSLTINP